MAKQIRMVIMALVLGALPQMAQAQQGPGVGPLQGGPRLDDRQLKDLRSPPPQDRGTVPPRAMLGCTFYEHAGFQGRSKKYTVIMGVKPGDYIREIAYVGDDFNDKMSSFICDNSCRTTVHTDRDFGGHQALNYNQANNLNTVSGPTRGGFNDLVSSLKVMCHVF